MHTSLAYGYWNIKFGKTIFRQYLNRVVELYTVQQSLKYFTRLSLLLSFFLTSKAISLVNIFKISPMYLYLLF
jgi:hypothetical protein